jgi:hypothetical protein
LILYVEAHPSPPDTITVPPGTYTLSLGALVINQSMSIVGSGANATTIQEPVPSNRTTMGDRVFDIAAVSGGLTPTVSISGVEIAGGDANPTNVFFGGDIRNAGVLTLSDDWVTNGFACSGGGVGNSNGSLTIVRSLISGNHSACGGADSGGVENFGTPGSPDLPGHLVIDDSTIAGNDARLGGGVFSWNDPNNTMTIENSTIADNAEQDEPSGTARAPAAGGLELGAGIARIKNSIIAGNVVITGGMTTPSNCAPGPGLTSLGRNIDSGTDCGLSDTTAGQADQSNTNPLLGPLENNGGPTMSLALGAGSPALDRVPASAADCPSTDQRGVPRPQGSACDIGAFELQVPPRCSNVSARTAPGGSAITVALNCTANAPGALSYSLASQPSHGTLSGLNSGTGVVTYTPKRGFAGTDRFGFNAANSGGTSAAATATITVPKPPPTRLNPSMTWTFGLARSYTTVRAMEATGIADGAKVSISCKGKGCRKKSRTVVPGTVKPHCSKGKKCPKPKPATSVNLAPVFKGWHFGAKAVLTVSVIKNGAIGKVYVFTFRPPHPPGTRVTCVAPGSKTLGKDC